MDAAGRQALLHEVNTLSVPAGALALWFLGQAGFIVKGGQTIVYIDPYLTNSIHESPWQTARKFGRAFPPPLLPEDIANAQAVFCTHEHGDHTDAPTLSVIAEKSPGAVFIGPANSRDILLKAGIADSRIVVPRVDEAQTIGDITYTALPAAHYTLDYDPQRGYRWFGFVIELNGVKFYHSGDTIIFDGLVERIKGHNPDIIALPLNGRDWWRDQQDIVGNLEMREAAQIVSEVGADVFIPIHNDLFDHNRIDPATLTAYMDRHLRWQKYHWLQPGELYFYVKR